jgi:gluconolactonase
MNLELTVVADGLGFPEGPVATQDGTLYFVDIFKQTLQRLEDGSEPELVAKIPGGPNGLAIGPDGNAYVCNNGGVFDFITVPSTPPGSQPPEDRNTYLLLPDSHCPGTHYGEYAEDAAGNPLKDTPEKAAGSICKVNLKTGAVTEIYGPSKGDSLIAPDDIVFDAHGPAGSFWFTDCGYQNDKIVRKGGVYAGHVNGQRPVKMAEIPSANGIGFSKDGKVLYVADTLYGRLWALQIDNFHNQDGTIDKTAHTRRVVQDNPAWPFPGKAVLALPGPQWLDSLKVEDSGRVCMGTLLRGGITVFNPADGSVDFLPVGGMVPNQEPGDPCTSNLCFGGPDMKSVWITASASGRIYKGTWPRPGLKLAYND